MAIPQKTDSCKLCTNKSSCFKKLSEEELNVIDKKRLEVSYKKGETVLKQGAFAPSILYLKKGLLKLYVEGKNDKNLILSIIPEGNLVGLPSLFGDPIYHYSAMAYEDSTVCLIDIEIFRKFSNENAKFSSEVIKILNESTLHSFDRFFALSQKNIPGRFADLMICLSKSIFKKEKFNLPLTRKELAELTSMSIESLSRVIKDFNESDLIRINGKEIEILDFNKLQRISENG